MCLLVEPGYKLGNIHQTHMRDLMSSAQMRSFGEEKRTRLTRQCLRCDVRFVCHGGCPKDRFVLSRDGEAGHNYLCRGLEAFFVHTQPAMQKMAALLRTGRASAEVMAWVALPK